MTVRCYRVPFRVNPFTNLTEHEYVAAESPEDAAAAVGDRAIGPATLAFPWLSIAPLPEDRVELPDGATRNSDGTVGATHPRTAEVVAWVRTYEGRNDFVRDVKFKMENGRQWNGQAPSKRGRAYRVSHKQVEALAKVKDSEAKRAEPGPGVAGLNLWAVLPYGTTRAAALNERGGLSFVRMDKVESGKWADWVFVKAVIGGNEDMRLGGQRPDSEEYRGQWPEVLRNVAADVMAAVERYGTELGECGVCGRALTNEESRQGGIGPVCRAKLNSDMGVA